jgi:hypothetical protein
MHIAERPSKGAVPNVPLSQLAQRLPSPQHHPRRCRSSEYVGPQGLRYVDAVGPKVTPEHLADKIVAIGYDKSTALARARSLKRIVAEVC